MSVVIDEFDSRGRGRVALTAFCLGLWTGLCLVPVAMDRRLWHWTAYGCMLGLFHVQEYLLTARFRPDVLSYDNFLVNHSKSYTVAHVACWLEFWTEWRFCSWKSPGVFSVIGLALAALGLGVRALGMVTAGRSFCHTVETMKRPEHVLVTHGVYAALRHPAYFGFFWFAVGSQVLLKNPVCVALYALASWKFFADRIPFEEELLHEFFGSAYVQYAQRTTIGIPWIPTGLPVQPRQGAAKDE